jgi:hypothetical protein
MAMICDACGTKYANDGGSAHLRVSPHRADFKVYQAHAVAGQTYEPLEPLTLDLCLACASKALAHLGLPTAVCEPPRLPPTDEAPELGGALTDEDLKNLGL